MNTAAPAAIRTALSWLLSEPTLVTLVSYSADSESSVYLVTRTYGRPGAVVLTCEVGRILLNGLYADLGDDMMAVVSLLDDAYPLGATEASLGNPILSTPYDGA